LSRIEKHAFIGTSLIEIILPSSVEVLNAGCFAECESLSSITFESGSRLQGIEREVLYQARQICWNFAPTVAIVIRLPK
jgi:hypothetical protein